MSIKTPFTYIKSYLTYLKYKSEIPRRDKCVYFDLENPSLWHRYFYVFALFFHMRGYDLYFPSGFWSYWKIRNENRHIYLLVKEGIARFGSPPEGVETLEITNQDLSHHYFSFVQRGDREEETAYHVPMCQHPMMYYRGLWDAQVNPVERKHSIFFIGKFKRDFYNILEEKWSGMLYSRTRLSDIVRERKLITTFDQQEDFWDFVKSDEDRRFVFITRDQFSFPLERIREVFATFDFFFAAPGVIMPFAHNVIEAMSVGTIPLIQDHYAEMFFPPLEHGIHAIRFSGEEELEDRVEAMYGMDEKQINQMRRAVLAYYKKYLTPEAVVGTIERNQFETIYLIAENNSVYAMEDSGGLRSGQLEP